MSKVGPLNRQQTAKAKVTFFEFQKNENNVRACSKLFKICLVSSDLEKHRQFDTRIVEITKVTFFLSLKVTFFLTVRHVGREILLT